MIKIIQQSTNERKQETIKTFKKIKPFLDKGQSFNKSLIMAGLMNPTQSGVSRAWSRDVVEYAKKQGYGG